MANSWGFDSPSCIRRILAPWCKAQLGWSRRTVINLGNYTAPQAETSPTAFRINAGYERRVSADRNRQRAGFENTMPQADWPIWTHRRIQAG